MMMLGLHVVLWFLTGSILVMAGLVAVGILSSIREGLAALDERRRLNERQHK